MLNRCTARALVQLVVMAQAREIDHSPLTDWATSDEIQCELDEADHPFHGAYLRDIVGNRPYEVYLCWRGEEQWLYIGEPCLNRATRLGSCCTAFKGHPGGCTWSYGDPQTHALIEWARYAEQYRKKYGSYPPTFLRNVSDGA